MSEHNSSKVPLKPQFQVSGGDPDYADRLIITFLYLYLNCFDSSSPHVLKQLAAICLLS